MKVILFDFDGTIADSVDIGLKITNRLAMEFGFQEIDREQFQRLQDLSSREILKELNIPMLKLPFLARRFSKELSLEVPHLQLIPGMKETLLELNYLGNQLGIVSTNSEQNIRSFLSGQGLTPIFNFVSATYSPFGKSRLIRRIMRQNQLNRELVFYVGDETRDIEAARKSRVSAIAATWGFNSSHILKSHQPDFLIHQPHELLDVIIKNP